MHCDHVLPFYLVCDGSFSMTDHMDTLNDGLIEFHRSIRDNAAVVERTRFCLISFARSAEVLLPLCRLSDVTAMSVLSGGATTNFGAAFTLLRELIHRDVDLLGAQSYRVCRPAVFFLSDGQPTDPATWPAAFAALTNPSWPARPNVIAFGIGDGDAVTIGRIGTFRAFISRASVQPEAALREFARALANTIMLSGASSAGSDEVILHVPTHIPGFVSVRIDPA